jgi:hypothetical protein
MRYYEVSITPCSGGFGEYYMGLIGSQDPYEDEAELLAECEQHVGSLYELGVDDLPPGVEDIRGNIHKPEGRVFAYLVDGADDREPRYFAIVER